MPFSGGFEGSYKVMKIVDLCRGVKIKGETETGNETRTPPVSVHN
jgi:hypothetical protein